MPRIRLSASPQTSDPRGSSKGSSTATRFFLRGLFFALSIVALHLFLVAVRDESLPSRSDSNSISRYLLSADTPNPSAVATNPSPIIVKRGDEDDDKDDGEDGEDECEDIWNQPNPCEYVSESCEADGIFDYLHLHFCTCANFQWASYTLFIILTVILFMLLGSTAEDYFCPILANISDSLKLSPDVAGITILALGNGAPDLFSTFAAIQRNRASIALGEILGAGNFVTMVVVGMVALAAHCKVKCFPFLRDVVFYLLSMTFICWVIFDEHVSLWEPVLFLVLYISYVVFSVGVNFFYATPEESKSPKEIPMKTFATQSASKDDEDETRPMTLEDDQLETDSIPFVVPKKTAGSLDTTEIESIMSISSDDHDQEDEEEEEESDEEVGIRLAKLPFKEMFEERVRMEVEKFKGESVLGKVQYLVMAPFTLIMNLTIPMAAPWNPIFGVLCPFFVSTMILILSPWSDDPFDGFSESLLMIPFPVIFLVASILLSSLIYFTTIHFRRVPRFQMPYMIIGFLMCVFWIFTVANELVSILHTWGLILNVSEAILGLTVLAWGNCIGDMVSDVVIAKQGLPGMAIAACFGGPLFNILVGLGVSLTWACFRNGVDYDLQLDNTMVVAFIFLGVGLVLTLIVVPLNGFVFPRWYALCLFGLYFLMTATNMSGLVDHLSID